MKRLLVLGAGTAGTMVVNKLRRRLDDEWQVTVVEQSYLHCYRPGTCSSRSEPMHPGTS